MTRKFCPITITIIILVVIQLTFLCIGINSQVTRVGTENYDPAYQMFTDILSQNGAYRLLNENGYVGSTSRTRSGDIGNLLLLNSTNDFNFFIKTIENSYDTHPIQHYNNQTSSFGFTIVLPPHVFTTQNISKLNQTTTPSAQLTTNYHIIGVISYLYPDEYLSDSPTQISTRPKMFNLDSQQPLSNFYPSQAHHDYIWNPTGTDIINSPLIFSLTFITRPSEITMAVEMGRQNFELFSDQVNKTKSSSETLPRLPSHLYIPHSSSLRYYNSGHKNSTHCLSQNTCTPVGGVNVLGVISQPNWISKQPWIFVPVPFNTRGLVQGLNFGFHEQYSSLIVMMAVAKTMTQYYNATIIPISDDSDDSDNTRQAFDFLMNENKDQKNNKNDFQTSSQQPQKKTQSKIVFGLLNGDSFDSIGTRSFLEDLWTSLVYRTNNATVAEFDLHDETIPSDLTTNVDFFPCNDTLPGFSRPPLAPYLNTTNAACIEPRFRTQTSMFQGLDLRYLDTIIQLSSPVRDTLYAHTEHSALDPQQKDEIDTIIDQYNQIAQNVTVLKRTNLLSIQKADETITPGIPPSAAGMFAYNYTYIPQTAYEALNITKIPKTIYISDFSTTQSTSPHKYSPFETLQDLLDGDRGTNILCGHATAFTRLLLKLSGSINDSSPDDDDDDNTTNNTQNILKLDDVKVDCDLIWTLIHCFTINRSCALFTEMNQAFDENNNQGAATPFTYQPSRPSTERGRELQKIQNSLPYALNAGVYYPQYSNDIEGLPRFLYNWFYYSGYYTAWNSNKYNSTMAWNYTKPDTNETMVNDNDLSELRMMNMTQYLDSLNHNDGRINDGDDVNNLKKTESTSNTPNETYDPILVAYSDDLQSHHKAMLKVAKNKVKKQNDNDENETNYIQSIIGSGNDDILAAITSEQISAQLSITQQSFRDPFNSLLSQKQEPMTASRRLGLYMKSIVNYSLGREANNTINDIDAQTGSTDIIDTANSLSTSSTLQETNNNIVNSHLNSLNNEINTLKDDNKDVKNEDDKEERQRATIHDTQMRILLSQSRFAYYHDSVEPYLRIDMHNDIFYIDESYNNIEPNQYTNMIYKPHIWTESTWGRSSGFSIFTETNFYQDLIIVGIGAGVTLLVLLIGFCMKKFLEKHIYLITPSPRLTQQFQAAEGHAHSTGLDYRGIVSKAKLD